MNSKKQIFLIVTLLIALVVVWTLVISSPKKSQKQAITLEEESGLELKVILEIAGEYLNNKEAVMEFSYEEDNDPFSFGERSTSGKNTALGRITLKGILWDSKKPLAIINEEVVEEGSIIKGIKIKKIEPDHVILEAEGKEEILSIEGVRKTRKIEK